MRYVVTIAKAPNIAHVACFRNMFHADPPRLIATIDDDDNTMISPNRINIEMTAVMQ